VAPRSTIREIRHSLIRSPLRRAAHLRLNRDVADPGAFDVGYAPDSGSKADIPFSPSRASNGLMRCSKQPPYSITLSAWPSNEGGLDSALAFRRQLDG